MCVYYNMFWGSVKHFRGYFPLDHSFLIIWGEKTPVSIFNSRFSIFSFAMGDSVEEGVC